MADNTSFLDHRPCSDNVFGPAVVNCRQNFDFTLLFEQTILSITPSALLLILAVARFYGLRNQDQKATVDSFCRLKIAISILVASVRLTLLGLWVPNKYGQTHASIASTILAFLASATIIPLSYVEHVRSIQPSTLVNIYLLVSIVLDLPQARTLFFRTGDTAIASVFCAMLTAKLCLLILEARRKQLLPDPNCFHRSPEAVSGIIERTLFWWLNSLLVAGYQKLFTVTDLYPIDREMYSETLGIRLKHRWRLNQDSNKSHGLLKALLSCFYWQLLSPVPARVLLIGFNYAQPFLISRIISYISDNHSPRDNGTRYGLIGATLLTYLGRALFNALYKHKVYRSTTMMRGAITYLIYHQMVNVPNSSDEDLMSVTLMSTDVERIQTSFEDFHECWGQLLEILIGVYILSTYLGWISVAPLAIVLLSAMGSTRIAKRIGEKQKLWASSIQQRVGAASSLLNHIKSIRMSGLTHIMFQKVQTLRLAELENQKGLRWMILTTNVFANIPPVFGPAVTLAVYMIQAKVKGLELLNTSQAFSSLATLSLLISPANRFLFAIPSVAACLGSIERLQSFLDANSMFSNRRGSFDLSNHDGTMGTQPPISLQYLRGPPVDLDSSLSIDIRDCSIQYPGSERPVLNALNVKIQKGSLVMIAGPVGCGKSTLLKAILGELPCSRGRIITDPSKIAYCSQSPWLLNDSIQQNIVGPARGCAIDENWYSSVLRICALEHDLHSFPEGDLTVIGTRGLLLSGGQRQRLALARAIYHRPNILLLDDVLSALDARTEAEVVRNLLDSDGLFRRLNMTVVLVTHAAHILPLAEKLIILSPDGQIVEQKPPGGLTVDCTDVLGAACKDDPSNVSETKQIVQGVNKSNEEQKQDLSRQTGDLAVYTYYLRYIGWPLSMLFVGSVVCNTFTSLFPQIILGWWTSDVGSHFVLYLAVYMMLPIVTLLAMALAIWFMLIKIAPKTSAQLHEVLLETVIRASMSFFDKTDSGSLLNRFSQDMTLLDSRLPSAIMLAIFNLSRCLGQLVFVSEGASYMALTLPVLFAVIYVLQRFYLRTSRQLRLLDLEAKNPLYTLFTETQEGSSSIRAFGWQKEFLDILTRRLDASQSPFYLLLCAQRWLQLVLDLIVCSMAVVVVSLALAVRSTSTDRVMIGIALNNIINLGVDMNQLITAWTDLETSLGAIARLKQLQALTPLEKQSSETIDPPIDWPRSGSIEFRNVTVTYGGNVPALKDISLSVKPGEKIALCGRTGSGKSTLLSAFLQLPDVQSGSIVVDGIDLKTLDRNLIRECVTVIPQEPFLTGSTVRLSIDPTGCVSADECISTLKEVNLWPFFEAKNGLETSMDGGGVVSMSQGQKQLLCLCRGILKKKTSILILDEATSNVDPTTDQLMQRIIRERFGGCTIITITHRLHTILDNDKVAILDGGSLIEVGNPQELLRCQSAFRELFGSGETYGALSLSSQRR